MKLSYYNITAQHYTLQLGKARFIQNAIWVVERRSCHLTLGFLFRNCRFWWLERVWTTILTNQKLLLVFRLRWPAQAANFDRRLQNWLRNRLWNLSYKYQSRPVLARDSLWSLSCFKRSEIIIFGTDTSLRSSWNLDFLFWFLKILLKDFVSLEISFWAVIKIITYVLSFMGKTCIPSFQRKTWTTLLYTLFIIIYLLRFRLNYFF